MSANKMATDANSFFGRIIQKTEETFNLTEKTMIDASLENMIKQGEARRKWAESLIAQTENMVQPNPALRVEDMVLKGLDRKKERITAAEQLGESMQRIGEQLSQGGRGGSSMVRCGQAQIAIGQAEKVLQQQLSDDYLSFLQKYVANEAKNAKVESDKVESCRLDLDRAKTVLKRANSSKKQQCEQSVTEAQTAFDRQCDMAKSAIQTSIRVFDDQTEPLNKLLRAQQEYFRSCLNALDSAMS